MRLQFLLLLAVITEVSASGDSCVGRCGDKWDRSNPCQCDSICANDKNCCPDYEDTCTKLLAVITEVSASGDSCVGRCDKWDGSKPCQCDSICASHKNCCPDYEDTCTKLLAVITEVSASNDSCVGRCDKYDRGDPCKCDPSCGKYKNCCPDYEDTCTKPLPKSSNGTPENDGTTPTPQLSANNQTSTSVILKLKLTHRTIADFNHKQLQHTESALEMTKPQPLTQEVPVTSKTQVSLPDPPNHRDPITTEALQTEAAAQTPARSIKTSPTQAPNPAAETTIRPTQAPDPDAETCSGRPFDSFMQLKNGSIYAFRGLYFFELDQKSVLPGYPKLIEDVWGISGPIDAAFTRLNCQGKTYIFKGTKYWKFDNGELEEDYPREISVGFDKIPDHVDAVFALPASSHNGKERVYFFKGEQYYTYEFLHKPSQDECIKMSESSTSTMNYEPFFTELFSDLPQHHDHYHFINKDWKGLRAPVDAAMAGGIHIRSPRWPQRRVESQYNQQWGRQQYQQNGRQWGQRRRSRSPFWESTAEEAMKMGQGFAERGMEMGLRLAEKRMELEEKLGRDWDRRWDQDWDQDRQRDNQRLNNQGNYDSRADGSYWDYSQRKIPIQSVYFFKGDQYYRADLRTKRVDPAMPSYPRSIAKYWLGCSNSTGAERK